MFSVCSYLHGSPDARVLNIIFPPADCDLATYLSVEQNAPRDAEARLKIIGAMVGVADGLAWLKSKSEYPSSSRAYERSTYHHGDLNPDNILVSRVNERNGPIFKIADFGRAVRQSSPVRKERSIALSAWFRTKHTLRVDQIQGTFTAPELSSDDAQLSDTTDVWPFGCILLVVLVFNHSGPTGVTQFQTARGRNSTIDSFFKPGRWRLKQKRAVCEYIKLLRNRNSDLNESDKFVNEDLLTLLQERVLVPDPNSRISMDRVKDRMMEVYSKRDMVTPKTLHRKERWVKFHCCSQSPQGEFEVFHDSRNDCALSIWRVGSTQRLCRLRSVSEASSAQRSRRLCPRSESCGTATICQVLSNQNPLEVCLH
jgi:serine/threonine protein kinase